MGKAQDLDAIEAALKTHLADEWYIEKSLRFNGITTDLLLVHPERGVILIGLMNVAKDFDFESYNKRRKEVAEAFFRGSQKRHSLKSPHSMRVGKVWLTHVMSSLTVARNF